MSEYALRWRCLIGGGQDTIVTLSGAKPRTDRTVGSIAQLYKSHNPILIAFYDMNGETDSLLF